MGLINGKSGRAAILCYVHSLTTTRVIFLRAKSDTRQAYGACTAWVHTQFGIHIKRFHSDPGREYMGEDFTRHLRLQGTERHLTMAKTPQQLKPPLQVALSACTPC